MTKNAGFDGKITISRGSDNKINIRLYDCNSVQTFVTAELTMENYARALCNEGGVEVKLHIQGLNKVGKHRVTELRQAVIRGVNHSTEKLKLWLEKNKQPDLGWEMDCNLNSRTDVVKNATHTTVNYRVHSWVRKLKKG